MYITKEELDKAIKEECSPSQSNSLGCEEQLINYDHFLHDPIAEYIVKKEKYSLWSYPQEIKIYIHDCWDGYSEYTILDDWKEVTVYWKYRSEEKYFHFNSRPEFLKAIADAEGVREP